MIQGRPKTLVMGILNVTPDSFSDGGRFTASENLQAQIQKMIDDGADILDVGGESTRPFADSVSEEEEIRRVIPAIMAIREISKIPVSIDTTKAIVARTALDSGADMVNDISAMRYDSAMIDVVLSYDAPVIIMHMQGTPRSMQVEPHYGDVVRDIYTFFEERIDWLIQKGVEKRRIVIDPGIGFGKTVKHNLTLLRDIGKFEGLGCPILVGHSRKSFLGKILGLEVEERDVATAAISAICALKRVAIVRVHDVAATVQAVRITEAIVSA